MAKHAHHGFTHTHIEHHGDGSATVHHVHHEGPQKDVKHAALNLDHIHDSLQEIGRASCRERVSSPV